MTPEPADLTVAEAAAALGVTERRLRRLLALPENAARTVTRTRRTVTGTRRVTVLPVALVAELRAGFERETTPEPAQEERGANGYANSDTNAAERGASPFTPAMVAATYERLIEAKDAQIRALEQALEAEREARRDAYAALSREQTLRAIGPAPQAEETPARRSWWPWRRRRKEQT